MRYQSPPGSSRSRAGRTSCPSSNERCPLSCPTHVGQVLGIAHLPASRPHSPRTWRQEWMQLAAGCALACREWTSSSRGRPRCAIDAREVRVTMVRRPAARWTQRRRVERELDLRRRRVGRRAANCRCSRLGGRKRRPGHRCAESGGRRREEDAAARITCGAARLHVMRVIRRVAGGPRQGLRHVGRPAGFRGGAHTIVAMIRRLVMRHARVHGGRERHLQHGEHQEQSGQPAAWHHAYPTARSWGSHASQGERRPRCERRRSSRRRCR